MQHITLITTGGTIEKTYDELTGSLENRRSIVRRMLRRLRLVGTEIHTLELMSKDSLLIDEHDRQRIVDAVIDADGAGKESATPASGIVILHGTDTLELTGEALHAAIPEPRVPIVLTGAMRPYEMVRTDALQNLTEAIFATGLLEPGVWCVAHGRALRFPGVKKNRQLSTFVKHEGDGSVGAGGANSGATGA
ncbi:MAG: asparaginase domain-containing protein [Planctomycetota bacterium]|nr:asparaginase domain-containing protein [Planctomycetota bacterium]